MRLLFGALLFLICFGSVFPLVAVASNDAERIKVHIIAAPHLDPSWVQTFHQYYPKVRKIIMAAIEQLELNPKRRFNFEGLSYLQRFLSEASHDDRGRLLDLVRNGQFHIPHGGWVSPDEANVDLYGALTNLQAGYDFASGVLGVVPSTYFQVDPFGHSSLSPFILGHSPASFMICDRVDWRIKFKTRTMGLNDFVWEGSQFTRSSKTRVLASIFYKLYMYPDSLTPWKAGHIDKGHIKGHANTLQAHVNRVRKAHPTNQMMMPWGEDFGFQDAAYHFGVLDAFISEINGNDHYNFDLVYSTPEDFFQELIASQVELPLFTGDLVPFFERNDAYWSGYYSGIPLLKLKVREMQNGLRLADLALVLGSGADLAILNRARQDLSFAQHHDGITGTSKALVREDTFRILSNAMLNVSQTAVQHIAGSLDSESSLKFSLTNIVRAGVNVPVVITNPLLQSRVEVIQLSVPDCKMQAFDREGAKFQQQLTLWADGTCTLDVLLAVPGLGTRVIIVKTVSKPPKPAVFSSGTILHAGKTSLNFADGCVASLSSTYGKFPINCDFQGFPTKKSGAYLFLPAGDAQRLGGIGSTQIAEGSFVSYAVSKRGNVRSTVRVLRGGNAFELTVGMAAPRNVEAGVVFKTKLSSVGELYTDNGWEMRSRPTASNATSKVAAYQFPLTKAAAIFDEEKKQGLYVASRSGSGALNNKEGELHIMIQRNVQQDDDRGVNEPPADTSEFTAELLVAPFVVNPLIQNPSSFNHFVGPSSLFDMRPALFFDHRCDILVGKSSTSTVPNVVGSRVVTASSFTSDLFGVLVERRNSTTLSLTLGNVNPFEAIEIDFDVAFQPLGEIQTVLEVHANLFAKTTKQTIPVPKKELAIWPPSKCKQYPNTCPKQSFALRDVQQLVEVTSLSGHTVRIGPMDIIGIEISFVTAFKGEVLSNWGDSLPTAILFEDCVSDCDVSDEETDPQDEDLSEDISEDTKSVRDFHVIERAPVQTSKLDDTQSLGLMIAGFALVILVISIRVASKGYRTRGIQV